jgi:Protein of unknown function (DUF2442)
MPPTETTPPDSAAGIVPPARSAAPWRLASVRPDEDFRLHVVFVDGTAGDVHLRAFIESPAANGTLFEPLREPRYFRQVRIELGAVAWPNGADLAPDAMYDAIRASGQWVVAA